MSVKLDEDNIAALLGKTITELDDSNPNEIIFVVGKDVYVMWDELSFLYDVDGKLTDLIGNKLLVTKQIIKGERTYYKLETETSKITITWQLLRT